MWEHYSKHDEIRGGESPKIRPCPTRPCRVGGEPAYPGLARAGEGAVWAQPCRCAARRPVTPQETAPAPWYISSHGPSGPSSCARALRSGLARRQPAGAAAGHPSQIALAGLVGCLAAFCAPRPGALCGRARVWAPRTQQPLDGSREQVGRRVEIKRPEPKDVHLTDLHAVSLVRPPHMLALEGRRIAPVPRSHRMRAKPGQILCLSAGFAL